MDAAYLVGLYVLLQNICSTECIIIDIFKNHLFLVLLISSLMISNLPLLILLVAGNALIDVSHELAILSQGEIVQVECEVLTVVLVGHATDNLEYASLLI